jgi:hypothetical protein
MKTLSQRTLVAVMRALREHGMPVHELEAGPGLGELHYENDFPLGHAYKAGNPCGDSIIYSWLRSTHLIRVGPNGNMHSRT